MMQLEKLWGWWSHRQGLDSSMTDLSCRELLARIGWARSVAGASPYLTIWSRLGVGCGQVDADASALEIFELPSARGCTYVVPADHFALALAAGQSFGEGDLSVARKHLGVTDAEIDELGEKVIAALGAGDLDPKDLRDVLGGAVRSFGEEGRKRGVGTSLPLALGRLQSQGRIRRKPVNGRLDVQRFSYEVWSPSPLEAFALSGDEVCVELARHYFGWIGPATLKEFCWFSGLGVGAARKAVASLDLVPMEPGSDRLLLAQDLAGFKAYEPSEDPDVRFVGSLDSLFLLRRDLAGLVHPEDDQVQVLSEKKVQALAQLVDSPFNAIADRGRVVGFWDYDADAEEVVWAALTRPTRQMEQEAERLQEYVRSDLGDVRTFSLDSPKSRGPRLAALRELV